MQIRFNFRQRPYVLTVLDLAPEPESSLNRFLDVLAVFGPTLGGLIGWYVRDLDAKRSRRHDRMAGLFRGREQMREELADLFDRLTSSGKIPSEVSELLAPYLTTPGAATDDHDHTGEAPMDAHGLKILFDDVNALAGMVGKMQFQTMETLCRGKLAQLRAYHGRDMIDDDTYETMSQRLAATLEQAAKLADQAARPDQAETDQPGAAS